MGLDNRAQLEVFTEALLEMARTLADPLPAMRHLVKNYVGATEKDAARWRAVRAWFSVGEADDGDGTLGVTCGECFPNCEGPLFLFVLAQTTIDDDGNFMEQEDWPSVDEAIDQLIARRLAGGEPAL
jgi:hypothetical protein